MKVRGVVLGLVLAAITSCRGADRASAPTPPQTPPNLAALEADLQQGRASAADNLLLAKVWIDGGRYQNALDLLDRLKVVEPALENRRQILRGLALEGLVRSADAWSAYEAALAAVPDDPAAILREAAYSFRSGDAVRALRYVQRSLARAPGSAEGYYLVYVLETDAQARDRALVNLIGADGPDGPWATRALAYRGR
jgi:tetratricopeptide (TPR) repeat protein